MSEEPGPAAPPPKRSAGACVTGLEPATAVADPADHLGALRVPRGPIIEASLTARPSVAGTGANLPIHSGQQRVDVETMPKRQIGGDPSCAAAWEAAISASPSERFLTVVDIYP